MCLSEYGCLGSIIFFYNDLSDQNASGKSSRILIKFEVN